MDRVKTTCEYELLRLSRV